MFGTTGQSMQTKLTFLAIVVVAGVGIALWKVIEWLGRDLSLMVAFATLATILGWKQLSNPVWLGIRFPWWGEKWWHPEE